MTVLTTEAKKLAQCQYPGTTCCQTSERRAPSPQSLFSCLGRWFAQSGGHVGHAHDKAPDDHGPNGTDDDTEPDETEEVEVLGIKLTRENERSGSGPLTAGVAPLVAVTALAVVRGVFWGRDS